MNRKLSKGEPPQVMTWGKALPILVLSAIFDALRFLFNMFWFFGPALAALYCTSVVSDSVGSLGGATATACEAGGVVAGYFGFGVLAIFGTIMAMVVGLVGWLAVGLIMLLTNARIFKESLWFAGSLLASQIPFINAFPLLTVTTWKMHHAQIKRDKEALKKYEKEHADAELQERNQQIAEMQAQQAQQLQQQAANDNSYEIPEEEQEAA